MGKFEIFEIFSKKKSKNPTPLTVDPISFYINFFAGIVSSGSLYPGVKIIEKNETSIFAILKINLHHHRLKNNEISNFTTPKVEVVLNLPRT